MHMCARQTDRGCTAPPTRLRHAYVSHIIRADAPHHLLGLPGVRPGACQRVAAQPRPRAADNTMRVASALKCILYVLPQV